MKGKIYFKMIFYLFSCSCLMFVSSSYAEFYDVYSPAYVTVSDSCYGNCGSYFSGCGVTGCSNFSCSSYANPCYGHCGNFDYPYPVNSGRTYQMQEGEYAWVP